MSSPTRSVYTIPFGPISVSAAHDFFQLDPVVNRPLVIHGITITQTSEPSSEEEQLLIQIIRGYNTDGSGGSIVTPTPLLADDAAMSGEARINNTTLATGGTPLVLHSEAFNSRLGFYFTPTPELRPVTKLNNVLTVVRLVNAPADAITFTGTMYVEER